MPLYKVPLKKLYFDRENPENTRIIYGHMPIEAASFDNAVNKVRSFLQWNATGGTLQTIDPRIIWEEDPEEWSENDWVYEDFSFGIDSDELEKNEGEIVPDANPDAKTFTLTPRQQQLLGYALVFLIRNFDENNEEDLSMTEKEVIKEGVKTGLIEWSLCAD